MYTPQGEPSLIRTKYTRLVLTTIHRASSVDTSLEVVRVVLLPVSAQNIGEASTESLVFPAFNCASYEIIQVHYLPVGRKYDNYHQHEEDARSTDYQDDGYGIGRHN